MCTHPIRARIAGCPAVRGVILTFTYTVPTPGSLTFRVTFGGFPGVEVLGTDSAVSTGWAPAGR